MTVLRMIGLLSDPMSMSLEERVLAAYYERLNAYAVDKSRVIVDRIPVGRSGACRARRQH